MSSHAKTRAGGRQVQLAAAALLCAVVLAGCASGVAHDHASAPGALASGSAPATSQRGPLAHPATTPVPDPVPGNIHQTVRAATVTTKPPVSLRAVAAFGTGVTAQIMSIKAIEYHAVGPGQVSGPGLRLVIQINNGTPKPIGLDNAVVTIPAGHRTPVTVNFSYAGGGPIVLFKGDTA